MATGSDRALIVVDVQRDFCEGGTLGVDGGGAVAVAISEYVRRNRDRYRLVTASRDWHIDPGPHFADPGHHPDFRDRWPVHCVAGSDGARWHAGLVLPRDTVVITKGQYQAAYSAFDGADDAGRPLSDLLADAGVRAVDIVGIATSFCVQATAIDARRAGLATQVLVDLVADVDPTVTPATLAALLAAGVAIEPATGAETT